MAAYYLFISFFIFVYFDYKYIYWFIDNNLIYSTSGSKLNCELGKTNNFQKTLSELSSYLSIDWKIIIVSIVFLSILISSISWFFLEQTPIILNIFSKELNITDIMSSIWFEFKVLYYTSLVLFCIILVIINRNKILKFSRKFVEKITNNYKTETDAKQNIKDYVIAKNEDDEVVTITDEAMYKNVLITGSIGSGKTSGAISNITYHLIKSGKGGLILDVKGNFVDTVKAMCTKLDRLSDLKIISMADKCFYPILQTGIEPLEQAYKVKQIITLLSVGTSSDPYWLDKVENVLMNMFIIIEYVYKKLDLLKLHKAVTDEKYIENMILQIRDKARKKPPDEKTSYELHNAINFIQNEFLKLDPKVQSIIKSEITRFTIPLITDYEIYNRFCIGSELEEIEFNPKNIVVLSLNIGKNRALSRIIATNLKLSFQKYILSNLKNPTSMFFIADEFQEFCNEEDSHFLSLSREAKCINVIAVQSYSSIRNTLKNDSATSVLIQNLVNKIWFRNDDNYTIKETIKYLGKTYATRENKSIQESGTDSKKYIFKKGFKNKKSNISKTISYSMVKEDAYDENFFTIELKTFEALAFIVDETNVKLPQKIIFERWK